MYLKVKLLTIYGPSSSNSLPSKGQGEQKGLGKFALCCLHTSAELMPRMKQPVAFKTVFWSQFLACSSAEVCGFDQCHLRTPLIRLIIC